MTFKEFLIDKYGYNEPIYSDEVEYGYYPLDLIRCELEKLVANNEIKRFEKDIYYFSRKTFFGDTLLDPQKVVRKRYITSGSNVYGYVAGVSLLNISGISRQVPNLIEIVTNKADDYPQTFNIGGIQRVFVRRSQVTITVENASVLQFLELMSLISPKSLDEAERYNIQEYIKDRNVNLRDAYQYLNDFPIEAKINLQECGIFNDIT